MTRRLLAELPAALARWEETDPVLAALARRHPPGPRTNWKGSAFSALVESITHQQVSLAAGMTIFGRVKEACGGRVTPEAVLALGPRRLRACGLSSQKRAYVTDLARRVEAGELSFRRLARAADEDVVAALTEVQGIGPWTAKMFLLFHLERPDVLAADDLGLQLAAAKAYGVPPKRARRFLEGRRAAWSPYASLASLTLWDSRRTGGPEKG